MEAERFDAPQWLIDAKNFKKEFGTDDPFAAVAEALKKGEVKRAALHRPGKIITAENGKQYHVDEKGTWRRVKP